MRFQVNEAVKIRKGEKFVHGKIHEELPQGYMVVEVGGFKKPEFRSEDDIRKFYHMEVEEYNRQVAERMPICKEVMSRFLKQMFGESMPVVEKQGLLYTYEENFWIEPTMVEKPRIGGFQEVFGYQVHRVNYDDDLVTTQLLGEFSQMYDALHTLGLAIQEHRQNEFFHEETTRVLAEECNGMEDFMYPI